MTGQIYFTRNATVQNEREMRPEDQKEKNVAEVFKLKMFL